MDSFGNKLVYKAKSAFQAVSSTAEKAFSEIKAELKADFARATSALQSSPIPSSPIPKSYGDLPWIAKNEHEKCHEEEFKHGIFEIAKNPEEYLLKEYDESILIDMRAAMASAGAILEADEELRAVRFNVVPRLLTEKEFWRRYFICVQRIKQQVLEGSLEKDSQKTGDDMLDKDEKMEDREDHTDSLKYRESSLSIKDENADTAMDILFQAVAICPSTVIQKLARSVIISRSYASISEMANSNSEADEDRDEEGDVFFPWSPLLNSVVKLNQNLSLKLNRLNNLNPFSSAIPIKPINDSLVGRKKDVPPDISAVSDSHYALLFTLFDNNADIESNSRDDDEEEVEEARRPENDTFYFRTTSFSIHSTSETHFLEELHGAPPRSFVADLAEIIASLKSEKKMALFWKEVMAEVRKHWMKGHPIPRIPLDSPPNLHMCLLYQQFQLINCCIARRKKRSRALKSLLNQEDNSHSCPSPLKSLPDLDSSRSDLPSNLDSPNTPNLEYNNSVPNSINFTHLAISSKSKVEGNQSSVSGNDKTESLFLSSLPSLSPLNTKQSLNDESISIPRGSKLPILKTQLKQQQRQKPVFAKLSDGTFIPRLGILGKVQGGLTLLETGEPMYAPVSQDEPLYTEDLLRETEELIMRTGSAGTGCSQLLSDMQAFKAANPGCIMEDFVRWYSPLDWSSQPQSPTSESENPYQTSVLPTSDIKNLESPETTENDRKSYERQCNGHPDTDDILDSEKRLREEALTGENGILEETLQETRVTRSPNENTVNNGHYLKRGYLSARMKAEGNLWQELWKLAKPIPAMKQTPIFDEELAGESTLESLEKIAPSDLFEQLFIVLLGSGFSVASRAPQATVDPISSQLRDCTNVLLSTCTRGMSVSKLEGLCKVYQDMETLINATHIQ